MRLASHLTLLAAVLLPAIVLSEPRGGRTQLYDFHITFRTESSTTNTLEDALYEISRITGVSISYLDQRAGRRQDLPSVVGRLTAGQAIETLLTPMGIGYEWVNDHTLYAGTMSRQVIQHFRDTNVATYDGTQRLPNAIARVFDFYIDRVPLEDLSDPLSYYLGIRIRTAPSADSILRAPIGPLKCKCSARKAIEFLYNSPRTMYEWTGPLEVTVRKRRWTDPPFRGRWGAGAAPDVTVEANRLSWFAPEQQPAVTLSSTDIERLGVSSVAQALDYIAQQPFSKSEGLRADGAQFAELRGLGLDTTLVLINGHRMRAAANSFERAAVDLNIIPVVAVERIEVYLDSTPMSVAADAIGGMINVILTSDARDPKVDVHYGTADGGGRERRASFTSGIVRDSFQATAVFDYFDRENLLGRARDRWRNQDYRRFGGTDWRSQASNPGNVSSLTANNLPGLPAWFAAVPSPQGEALTADDFLATAGQRNLTSLVAYRSVLPETQRASAVLTFDWRLAPESHLFGQVLYSARENLLGDSPPSVSATIPGDNPHNPFGVPVRVNFLASEIPRERVTKKDYLHALVGAQGEIAEWNWDVAATRTAGNFEYVLRGDLNQNLVLRSLAESDPLRSLNVFADGPGGSASLLESLAAPAVPLEFSSHNTDVTVQIRGSPFKWYAGASIVSLGVTWSSFGQSVADMHMSTRNREIRSAFGQLSVPLLAGEASAPLLALEAQGRVDHISDLRSVANSQFTVDWRVNDNVTLQATYGTSYRVPTLYELYQPIVTLSTFTPLGDPRRGGEVRDITVLFGGNPELDLATATSWSVGLTVRPDWRNRFQLSGTYWETAIKDSVSPVNVAVALNREDLFAEHVVRAPASAADIALGWPGPLVSIDAKPAVGGTLDASGFDVQASIGVSTPYGRITPELSATWMREFRTVDWPGLPEVERVGLAGFPGSIPRWHVIAGLTWSRGAYEVSAKARFLGAYADVNLLNQKTGRDVPAHTLVDLQASVQLGHDTESTAISREVTVRMGVSNLFNRSPPFAEIGTNWGYDPSHGDLRNRFVYLRLAKEF